MSTQQTPQPCSQTPFITFEGGEGVGKTTQINLLLERLQDRGISAIKTREPGGSPHFGQRLRNFLISGQAQSYGAFAEALLFSVDRLYHVDEVIKPALASHQWVICDRYIDSTRVYQGSVGFVQPCILRALERLTVGDLYPTLTFVLDLSPEIGLTRARQRTGGGNDRFEAQSLTYHKRIQSAFLDNGAHETKRTLVIPVGNSSPETVAKKVWSAVEKRFLCTT
jgi:dTMP kinase